jgi:hypothetical protein
MAYILEPQAFLKYLPEPLSHCKSYDDLFRRSIRRPSQRKTKRPKTVDKALYIVLGIAIFLALGYVFGILDLIRQSREIDKKIDYSKLRPQPDDDDDD